MDPKTRERLVAHILGEATADENAAILRELAAETDAGAELRAERDRLASTIGLVREFGGAARTLSVDRREALERQAGAPQVLAPVIPFRRRRAMLAVAAILLATSASAVVWFGSDPVRRAKLFGDEVAQAPQSEPARGGDRGRDGAFKSDQLHDDLSAGRLSLDPSAASDAHLGEERRSEALRESGGRDAERLNGLGYIGDKGVNLAPGAKTGSSSFFLGAAPELADAGETAPSDSSTKKDDLSALLSRVGYIEAPTAAAPSPNTHTQTDEKLKRLEDKGGLAATETAWDAGGAAVQRRRGGSVPSASKDPAQNSPTGGFVGGTVMIPGVVPGNGGSAAPAPAPNPAGASAGLEPAPSDRRRSLESATELVEELVDHETDSDVPAFDDALRFGLDLDHWTRDQLRPWMGDFEAMQAHERDVLAKQGLEPNDKGLRKLLEGLGQVAPNSSEPLDSAEMLGVRWRLFGRAVLERRLNSVLNDCNRRPAESLADMFFRHWGTRPFERTAIDSVSTFAADVDTASYTLARKMLDAGVLPGADQIRVEEWINYFDAELERPAGSTFAITGQLAPNPFDAGRTGEPTWLMRVGLQGREVQDFERSGLVLTFAVDTSGSMAREGRTELVKNALQQLLTKLDSRDSLAIVAFDNAARVVLEPTPATDRGRIEAAIASLGASGGTNVEGGLVAAYELAARGYDLERENRVVLLSDGVGNIGETDQNRILERVASSRTNLIYLNTIGVGLENHNDTFLEQLANRGNGVSDYVDTPLEARRAFVERFTGAFQTIARDVKIQVDFDPAHVREYRLIGYENRAVADRSFRDDTVDGGEVGAGHSVVALYELRGVDLALANGEPSSAPIATVRVRYLPPTSGTGAPAAVELAKAVGASDAFWSFDAAPIGLRKNVLVARVAEVLKRSTHVRSDSLDTVAAAIELAANQSPEMEFRAFAGLFARNRAAIGALVRPPSPVEARLDELRYLRYEIEVERTSPGTPDAKKLEDLTARVSTLEEEVRRLVFDGLAAAPQPVGGSGGDDR